MNIWTGLLFLEGAVADTSLARELTQDTAATHVPTAAETDLPAADRWSDGLDLTA